jgi:hypothetical protein
VTASDNRAGQVAVELSVCAEHRIVLVVAAVMVMADSAARRCAGGAVGPHSGRPGG